MFDRNLRGLLKREKNDIVAWLTERLKKGPAPHYEAIDHTSLKLRARQLVESLVESTGTQLASGEHIPFVSYVEQIAEERISEGYDLEEIQLALSKLEEKIWQLVVAWRVPKFQVKELGQATYIIGLAKDHLARIYLKHKKHAESSPSRLKENLELLSRGTDSAPVMEDDEMVKPSTDAGKTGGRARLDWPSIWW